MFPDRTKETALASYKDIDDMTCAEVKKQPPLARLGNEAVQYHTDFERYGTPASGKVDFYTLWTNREFYKKKGFISRMYNYSKNQKGEQADKTAQQKELSIWKSIAGVYFSTPQIFKPLLAMDYYCRFTPKVAVLDPTMGWGGRLLGACALDVPHYIGVELNKNLKRPYEEMVAMVRPFTKTKITLKFMDCLKVDYTQLKYDMVLTSPPYYNIEIYEGTKAKTKDDWDRDFYYPFFEKTFGGLMNGGHYCMNIPIEVYDRVAKPMMGAADILVPLNKVVRQAGGGETYKEYTYVWVKKAGWKPRIPPPKAEEIKGEGIEGSGVGFPITLDKYENLIVVRDDKLKGGTKSIFIPVIMERGIKEYVYASPVEGGFQMALSKNLGDKATIFVAKRKDRHPIQQEVIKNGSKVVEVPYGYFKNVSSKAKAYVEAKPTERKLVEWGGSSNQQLITDRMKAVLKKTGPLDEVWCAVGSGTLVQGIMEAVPPSTKVYGVQVGATYRGKKYPNLTIIKYPKSFNWESKMEVPFQSNANYDRKALEVALKRAKGKALFWNVW